MLHQCSGHAIRAIVFKFLATLIALALFGCPTRREETADLRAIHLSPDAPAVDVWQRGPDGLLLTGLSFTDSSNFITVDEGTYTIEITPAGALIDESVLTIDDVNLEEDGIYTAAVIGTLDDLQALLLAEDFTAVPAGEARVRVIHAAPDVSEVDVWNISDPEDPTPLVENVAFGGVSPNLLVPAVAYVIGLDVTGDEQPDLVFELPELADGAVVNIFAIQDADGEALLLIQSPDGTTTVVEQRPVTPELGEDEAGLRLVHLSPDAPAVDVWGPAVPLVTNLSFGEGTDHLNVSADFDLIEIVPAGQPREEAVLTVTLPALDPGEFYTAVVFGPVADLEALLLLDDLSPPAPGAIRVRPIHAAAAVDEVDIWVARPGQAPIAAFEDLAFGEASDYIQVLAGRYSIGLDVGRTSLIDFTAALGNITAATIANIYAVLDDDGVFFLVQENGRHTRVDALAEDPPTPPGQALPLGD